MVETEVTLSIISHGTRTNTFPNIVVHVGPRVQHLPSLIASTLSTTDNKLLPLALMLKCSSMVTSVDHATEVTPLKSTSMPTRRVSSTAHANNILATIWSQPSPLSMNARIAHGLHQLRARMVKKTASLSKVPDTTSQATTKSRELTR